MTGCAQVAWGDMQCAGVVGQAPALPAMRDRKPQKVADELLRPASGGRSGLREGSGGWPTAPGAAQQDLEVRFDDLQPAGELRDARSQIGRP